MSFTVGGAGGTFMVSVTAPQSCAWTPVSDSSWIHVDNGATQNGNGSFMITIDTLAHANPVRTGRVELWDPFPTTDLQIGLVINQTH
jgi:hypothetical protein